MASAFWDRKERISQPDEEQMEVGKERGTLS
jgi:hypothetical protein